MKFTPMAHQKKAIEFLETHDHGALFLGMGLGPQNRVYSGRSGPVHSR